MKRFLGFFIFIALLLCSHIAYAQEKAEPPQNPAASTLPKPLNAPTIASQNKPEEKQGNKHPTPAMEDLAAQKSMSKSAQKANSFALAQTVIGGLGLVLVLATTIFAYGAWQAGKAAVDVAQNATKAEFQPYFNVFNLLLISEDAWDSEIFDDEIKEARFLDQDGFVHFPIEFKFSNFGKTPAQNIRFEVSVTVSDFDDSSVIYEGSKIDPMIDVADYLTAEDGEDEFIFTVLLPSLKTTPYEKGYVDLLTQPVQIKVSAFFTDQFSDRERQYLFLFEGYCHDGGILKKSTKEIKQT